MNENDAPPLNDPGEGRAQHPSIGRMDCRPRKASTHCPAARLPSSAAAAQIAETDAGLSSAERGLRSISTFCDAGRPQSIDTAMTRSAAGQNHSSRDVGPDLAYSRRSWRKHAPQYAEANVVGHYGSGRNAPDVNRTVNTVEGGESLVTTG